MIYINSIVLILFMILYQICADPIDSIDRGHFNTREEIDLTKLPPLIDVAPCRPGQIPIFVNTASSDKYTKRRKIQRETWVAEAKQINSSLRIIFVMGKSKEMSGKYEEQVELESKLNEDILQFHFIDSYYNLTLKQLCWMYWCIKNCKTTPYVIKLDDDVLLNVQRLETKLKNKNFGHGLSGMECGYDSDRDPNSKFFMPEKIYPKQSYPFLLGPFYVITRDVLDKLYEVASNQNEFPFLDIEDIYITGIAAQLANIPRLHTYELLHKDKYIFDSVACCMFHVSAYSGLGNLSIKHVYFEWKSIHQIRDCLIPVGIKLIAIIAFIFIIFGVILHLRVIRKIRNLFRYFSIKLNRFIRFIYLRYIPF